MTEKEESSGGQPHPTPLDATTQKPASEDAGTPTTPPA